MTENKKRYVYHQSRDFGSLIEDTKENKCLHFMSQSTEELNALNDENEQLKKENQELHKLNQEYIDGLSDEKKETLSEMLNAILGDDEE